MVNTKLHTEPGLRGCICPTVSHVDRGRVILVMTMQDPNCPVNLKMNEDNESQTQEI